MGKGLRWADRGLSETWIAAGSAPPHTGRSLGQKASFSMAAQEPQCRNTSPSPGPSASCEVSARSYLQSKCCCCRPHTQSHRRAPCPEGHTDIENPDVAGQGSVHDPGRYREPHPSQAAAAEKSGVMRAVWTPCAGVAAEGARGHRVA